MNTENTQTNASAATTAHTPGPWNQAVPCSSNYNTIRHIESDGFTVSDVNCGAGEISQTEALANARLIAAAPDLLELLEGLLATAESVDAGNKAQHGRNCHGFATALFDKCHAAIARAKGDK